MIQRRLTHKVHVVTGPHAQVFSLLTLYTIIEKGHKVKVNVT